MNSSKYSYKGIPLTKYAEDHGINIKTIRSRLSKEKKKEKNKNLTDEMILNRIIETYKKDTSYKYKNVPLTTYCEEKGYNYKTIISRIQTLKKKEPEKPIDSIIDYAVENYNINGNTTLFYYDIPLKTFCDNSDFLNYSTIKERIKVKRKRGEVINIEEIVDSFLNAEHIGKYKYYYKNIPLIEYCKENGLNYKNIIIYISRHKNEERFKSDTVDEFVNKIMKEYTPFCIKYKVNGNSLYSYTLKKNLSYDGILRYIKTRLAKNETLVIEDLIKEALKISKKYHKYYKRIKIKKYRKCKYTYKKMSLHQYCDKKGISYKTIQSRIIKYKKESKELSEVIDEVINNYENMRVKYYYNGVILRKYCLEHPELNYNVIIQSVYIRIINKESLNNEIVQEIVDEEVHNYKRKEEPLHYNGLTLKEIKKIFENLHLNSEKEIEEICNVLKINYEAVLKISNMGYDIYQSLKILWFICEGKYDENKINFYRNISNYDELDIYKLFAIYKSGIYDTRYYCLEKFRGYIIKYIKKYSSLYNERIEYEEIISEINLYFIEIINKSCSNIPGQVINYINIYIKYQIMSLISEWGKNMSILKLNQKRFNDSEETLINSITYKNKDEESFSSSTLTELSKLSKEELRYIILRFKECYTYEDLCKYYNININEIKEKEDEILNKLRFNENIKKLIR